MIKAVIFDRDETLLTFDETAYIWVNKQLKDLNVGIDATAIDALWGSWDGGWPRTEEEETQFWQQFAQALIERYTLAPEIEPHLINIFNQYHTTFLPYTDTKTCLQSLHEAQVRLALLTNFELPSINKTLEYAGIDPNIFELTVSSATLNAWKPDPQAYNAVLEMLGLDPSVCVFVDNDLRNVEGARALGMRGIWLDRERSESDLSQDIVHSLELLPALLSA
jgi:2-haloalkanoic acid dehalogenase type II